MSPCNIVTLSGTITGEPPRPTAERVCLFKIECRHAFEHKSGDIGTTSFVLWCRAWGHGASSILRYGRGGLDVVVSGKLAYLSELNVVGIIADSVSYPRPSQLAKSEKSTPEIPCRVTL